MHHAARRVGFEPRAKTQRPTKQQRRMKMLEFNFIPVIACMIIFFVGCGGLMSCHQDAERTKLCIEKTGTLDCNYKSGHIELEVKSK
jgi:hypothetical protein